MKELTYNNYIINYKFPRLKAIRIIIAGPDVSTRNNAAN